MYVMMIAFAKSRNLLQSRYLLYLVTGAQKSRYRKFFGGVLGVVSYDNAKPLIAVFRNVDN